MATDYYKMGMGLGGAYFDGKDEGRERAYKEEKRAREKVLEGRVDEQYAQDQAKQKELTSAKQAYGLMDRMGVQNAQNVKANDADFDEAVRVTGLAQPMPAAAPLKPEWAPATELDRNGGLQRLALARDDYTALGALRKDADELGWKQTFGEHLKGYTGAPEQVDSAILALNESPRVSMGDPGKDGVIRASVVRPDKRADFFKLTKQDQAQLWAAGQMMERDPIRSLTIMAGVNKNLAQAIADDNDINFKLVEANLAQEEVGIKRDTQRETSRHNRVSEGIASAAERGRSDEAKLGRVVPMVDPVTGAATYGRMTLVGGKPVMQPLDMGGLALPKGPPDAGQVAALKAFYEAVAENPQMPPNERDRLVDRLGIGKLVGAGGGLSFNPTKAGGPAGVAAPGPARKDPGADAPTAPPTGEQKVKALYDKWQAAKGPWYLPTPAGNREAEMAEREYEQALQQFLRNNQR